MERWGGIGLVPDAPCPHSEHPPLTPEQTGGGAAERPRPPDAFAHMKRAGRQMRPAQDMAAADGGHPIRLFGFLILGRLLELALGHPGHQHVARPCKAGGG